MPPGARSPGHGTGGKLNSPVCGGLLMPPSDNHAKTPVVQRILVVEDQADARISLQQVLQLSLGLEVDTAEDGAQALERLQQRPYSIVITDLRMPRLSGMELIHAVHDRKINVTVVVTTGHGSIKEAVEAMRLGAYEFLTKPADPQHLCLLIQ